MRYAPRSRQGRSKPPQMREPRDEDHPVQDTGLAFGLGICRGVDAGAARGRGSWYGGAHAIGVGMPDIMIRRGTYSWMPPLPGTPGTEMSGVIEKIGPGVKSLRPGQRVVVSARDRPHRGGCYAEYNATPEGSVYPLPDGADLGQAAALANYQVAYHLLYDCVAIKKGSVSADPRCGRRHRQRAGRSRASCRTRRHRHLRRDGEDCVR